MESNANDLWWATNRQADCTYAMEYDAWQSAPQRQAMCAAKKPPFNKTQRQPFCLPQ